MRIVKLKALISCLDVNKQSVTTKKTTWSPFHADNQQLSDLNADIFNDNPEIGISRDKIFNEATSAKKILLTYYWGYPNRGPSRGGNFKKLIEPQQFRELQGSLNLLRHQELNEDRYNSLLSYVGLGPSTITKFLYFFNVRLDGKQCLILDDRIKKVFKKKYFDEFNQLHFRSGATTFDEYRTYNNIMHKLSRIMKVEPDQLELFLFLFPSNEE